MFQFPGANVRAAGPATASPSSELEIDSLTSDVGRDISETMTVAAPPPSFVATFVSDRTMLSRRGHAAFQIDPGNLCGSPRCSCCPLKPPLP